MVKTVKIIIGANYGDEGKGLATHQFAVDAAVQGQKCLNVLFSGGCQRGHTVETAEGLRHVFHHFGAGTFDGAASYITRDFIINPMEYMREYYELKHIGFAPVCFIEPQCRVTTPYDMLINRIVEEARGKDRHGSCGMGIWETSERYQIEFMAFSIGQLAMYSENVLKAILEDIRDKYLPERLANYGIKDIPEKYKSMLKSKALIANYIRDLEQMIKCCDICYNRSFTDFAKEYDYIIFEGSQGLALSGDNTEEYPNVTASVTGSYIALSELEFANIDTADIEVVYVTRSYFTRHGAGKLPNEICKEEINSKIIDETNLENEFQGKLRYAKFDGEALNKRVCNDIEQWEFTPYRGKIKCSLLITHINETKYMLFGKWASNCIYNNIYVSDRKYGFI